MSSQKLSTTVKLPETYQEHFKHLEELTCRIANRVLKKYWVEEHLIKIDGHRGRAGKYFDELEVFKAIEFYLPSRFRRCILEKVGETLRSQAGKLKVFQAIKPLLPNGIMTKYKKKQIRGKIYYGDEFVNLKEVGTLLERINNHHRKHGRYPDSYFDLQKCPEYGKGVLPYSADDGPEKGQMIQYEYCNGNLNVRLKVPTSPSPKFKEDWTWIEIVINSHDHFRLVAGSGEIKAPSFHPERGKTGEQMYLLNFPVEISGLYRREKTGKILATDLGTKKLGACVVMNKNDVQVSRPHFIRSSEIEKMRRLYHERNNLNAKLGNLRKRSLAYTDKFKHLQAEYKRVQNKLNHKREQLQHSVANQILFLAIRYNVDIVVFEDLRGLRAPRNRKSTSWSISTWARGILKDKVEYRVKLAGIRVATVPPWKTSRTCPRCGESGKTVRAPDLIVEEKRGGHFTCGECGYQADRDYVGALNVGRAYLEDGNLKEAKPVAYMESGNTPGDRSLGVRPTSIKVEKSVEPSSHPSRIVPSLGTLIDGSDEPRLESEPKGIVQLMADY